MKELLLQKHSHKRRYRSFFCPTILLDGIDDIIERWPGKLNKAKILFFAAVYGLEQKEMEFKEIEYFSGIKKERVMIRTTVELEESIGSILSLHEEFTQTDYFILSLVSFLKHCNESMQVMEKLFIAESENKERGLFLLSELRHHCECTDDFVLMHTGELFVSKKETYCLLSKEDLAAIFLHGTFKKSKVNPFDAYPAI